MIKDRVLLSAIVFSAAWHLFWASALTVVVVPKNTKPVKFSSVSFLGPILEPSMLKMSVAVHERSLPEKRYLSEIEDASAALPDKAGPDTYTEADIDSGADIETDETVTNLAILAIDEFKLEPPNFQ